MKPSSATVCGGAIALCAVLTSFACTKSSDGGASEDVGAAQSGDSGTIVSSFQADGGDGATTSPIGVPTTDAGGGVTLADASLEDSGATVTFSSNPNSVLSVIATVSLPGCTFASVVSTSATETLTTPQVVLDESGNGRIAVLGLAPSTTYTHVVQMTTAAGTTESFTATTLTTAALPAAVATMTVTIKPVTASPESGYFLVTGGGPYDYAFDATGTIRWYAAFGGSTLAEGKMQYDGTFTSYVGSSTGSEAVQGEYVRYTPDGTETATYTAVQDDGQSPVYTDPHEFLITQDSAGAEHFHMLGYQETAVTGDDAGTLASHELQRFSSSGALELTWRSSSRFTFADRLETDLPTDFDHTNAIAIDPTDGNYLVSFRNLDAIVKLDYQTGAVLWQLGGVQNQFTIVGDPLGGFWGQHSVRVLPNGDVLLYDNGLHHSPPESRAVEYKLDTTAMTATYVWEYRRLPVLETEFTGSVERQTSGNTLVAFAWVGVVDEADSAGNLVWEASLFNGTAARAVYRVRRLPSLYQYETP